MVVRNTFRYSPFPRNSVHSVDAVAFLKQARHVSGEIQRIHQVTDNTKWRCEVKHIAHNCGVAMLLKKSGRDRTSGTHP